MLKKNPRPTPDQIAYALHNIPGHKVGTVLCRRGAFTCSVVSVDINITGRQSHAAEPQAGHNPAGGLAKFLAWIAEQEHPDLESDEYTLATVVHVGVGTPGKYGVSPGQARVSLTLRSRQRARLEALRLAIEAHAAKVWAAPAFTVETDWKESFKSVENSERGAKSIAEVLSSLTTKERGPTELHQLAQPFSWGEDFSEILDVVGDGAMFGLGSGLEQPPLHDRAYVFNEACLWRGLEMFWGLVGLQAASTSA